MRREASRYTKVGQQRYGRSPSGFEISEAMSALDEYHNVQELPRIGDTMGAQYMKVGKKRLDDLWSITKDGLIASHPQLYTASATSLRPRREWDESCVEVVEGDNEDDDTPRGEAAYDDEVRVWTWQH